MDRYAIMLGKKPVKKKPSKTQSPESLVASLKNQVILKGTRKCSACKGIGFVMVDSDGRECKKCKGTGRLKVKKKNRNRGKAWGEKRTEIDRLWESVQAQLPDSLKTVDNPMRRGTICTK